MSRPFTVALLTLLAFSLPVSAKAPLTDLSALQWKHRVLLLNAASANQANLFQTRLLRASDEVQARHLYWFIVPADINADTPLLSNYPGTVSSQLGRQLKRTYFRSSTDRIVLIGKDGGIKYTDRTLQFKTLWARIDAMPMRKAEMREADPQQQ
ncbi:DUF4174 domain-containing protein [Lacimicrobium sp. SS2-24]|uniref:DUF4174 domain-containing protein n=1 Tax=Lacimicrobium sp. SS2-24 TaxID=2005569 RepID=UPI000B4B72E6|nr:DUF4174 domain-containing protein [Lacimicrobium sp. SS2-24]